MVTQKALCVFCSSSDAVAPGFFAAAEQLGALLAQSGYALVYGGAKVGLMGALARAVHVHGGKVIGIIPQSLFDKEIPYAEADELIVTKDMRERKAAMEARAEAFISLPGGFGTLEEVFEILTLKQLQAHNKPVVFVNTAGFYDPLVDLFEHIYRANFARPAYRELYHIAQDPAAALTYIQQYEPVTLPVEDKWFIK